MAEPTHELVVTARGDDGELVMRIGLLEEPENRYTGYIERKARDCYHDAFSTCLDPHVTVEFKPVATTAIVEGPHGHWYTIFRDELIAFPMDGDMPPAHPSQRDDGWYSPDDLTGEERVEVVARIRGPEPAAA